jgi:RNA polymerase sigma-54 factor
MFMGMSGEQRQDMRVSPSLIQYTHILQLSGIELRDMIMQELEENPALRLDETALCPACGDPLRRDGSCYRCQRGERLAEREARELVEYEDPDDTFDLLTSLADQRSLHEHLLSELAMMLEAEDMPIGEFLVGELDERGFLGMPLDMVAASLKVDEARVERVLAVLQAVGPIGVGARDVRECLLIQLARWEDAGESFPLVRRLVSEHLDDLGHARYGQLSRTLGVSHDEILAAREFIRGHLRPYPIVESLDMEPWERETGPGAVAPDVIVRAADDGEGYTIEVVDSRRYRLSVNPVYDQLAETIARDPEAVKREHMKAEEGELVQGQVRRAQAFLSHIRERRDTMVKVAAYVMERQAAFLKHGPRQLVPLTRAEVAEALDLHESTISRATKDKYVMLPNRQVLPFGHFFKAALSVKDLLREIVDLEPRPYTDSELADILAERGYPISRRTVTKYRLAMGILASNLR